MGWWRRWSRARGCRAMLAGGQSLVPMLNLRLVPVNQLVALDGLEELRTAERGSGSIRYGALLTHAAFEDRRVPDGSNGLMPYVAARIAFRSVRNRGTIGGALALADPAADWVTACIALEARMHLRGAGGERVVAAEEFVLGPYTTALEETEVLVAVEVPVRAAGERWGHAKVAVKVGEYAKSLAIALVDRGAARLVLGAVDGAPLVLRETAMAGLRGGDVMGAARAEIVASGREFSPGRLAMHTKTAVRALQQAMGQ